MRTVMVAAALALTEDTGPDIISSGIPHSSAPPFDRASGVARRSMDGGCVGAGIAAVADDLAV